MPAIHHQQQTSMMAVVQAMRITEVTQLLLTVLLIVWILQVMLLVVQAHRYQRGSGLQTIPILAITQVVLFIRKGPRPLNLPTSQSVLLQKTIN